MGAEIINADLASQYLIDANDFVVLMSGTDLTIDATTDPGFLADHNGIFTLTVLGQVVTYGQAAALGQDVAATMLGSLSVGEDGLLQSLTDVAIEIRRSGHLLDNDGVISGGNGGVRYASGVGDGQILNTGTVSSLLGSGVLVTGAAGGGAPSLFRITNTGQIDGATDAVSVSHESLELVNHGNVIGLGTGISVADDPSLANALVLMNTGLIQGGTFSVDATGHADDLTNAGTLLGAVLLGDGANLLANSGRVSGLVSAGSGDDHFTNASGGLVSGHVSLSDGANTLINHGTLAAGLTLGAGDDHLLSDGTITGSVALGDGSNSATLAGKVYGDVTGGSGADTVEIRGRVDGALSFGGAADVLVIDGEIGGGIGRAVDMGAGDDVVRLSTRSQIGTSRIDGGDGFDTLVSRAELADIINVEFIDLKGGQDLDLQADDSASTIYGNTGDNEIDGGAGPDALFGRRGDDVLLGGFGKDLLKGGRGQDVLIGGKGADVLDGGPGEDVFAFEAVTDSKKSAPDVIVDFKRGCDMIDLSTLADGSFTWLGTAGFTGTGAAELRFKSGGSPVDLRIDVDGDGSVDMAILLDGLTVIDAGDFYL